MSEALITVGVHRVRVSRSGSLRNGPTYVLVHGIGMSHRYFQPLINELVKTSAVLTIDLPGFGGSSRPEGALSIAEQAEVIHEVLEHERPEKPVLVGQSMGCQFVMELLRSYPACAKKAVLLGPTVNRHERTLAKQMLRLGQDSFLESSRANRYVVTDYIRSAKYHLLTLRYMLDDAIEDKAEKVTAELLILRGSRDPIVPHYWAEELCKRAPRAVLRETPGAAHLAQVTHSDLVARQIEAFVGQ